MTTTRRWRRATARAGLLVLLASTGTAGLATGTAGAATAASRAAPQTWTAQHLPAVPDPFGGLSRISCPSATFCLATGILTATWNGTSWHRAPLPGRAFNPSALSCTSATFCAAVGIINQNQLAAAAWNGTSWRITKKWTSIYGMVPSISCASATACLAVGGDANGEGPPAYPIAVWWNGKQWKQAPFPGREQIDGKLTSVSCSSPTACTAAGVQYHGKQPYPLTERWNGTRLTRQQTAAPTKAAAGTAVVACPAAAGCIAAGEGTGADYFQSWNGTTWAAMAAPTLPGNLTSLSCTAITSCLGTGSGKNASGQTAPFSARLAGHTWTVQWAGTPAGGNSTTLRGVSCTSASDCEAAGTYRVGTGQPQSLAERWDGTQWTVQYPPDGYAGDLNGQLLSISCATTTTCVSIGFLLATGTNLIPLSAVRTGSQWKFGPAPVDIGPQTVPEGISCPAVNMCMTAGYYFGPGDDGQQAPWAAIWNGTRWRTVIPPSPGVFGLLNTVSCASATFCVAVGNGGTHNEQLLYSWNGTSWSRMTAPAQELYSDTTSVSCVSARYCVAGGGDGDSDPWFAEVWNGQAWKIVHTSGDPEIDALTCSSATACTAVGDSDQANQVAIRRWNGTAWSAQAAAKAPPGGAFPYMGGVACPAATACVAVGSRYTRGTEAALPLVEAWNGSQWTIQSVFGLGAGALASVSCPALAACTIIGDPNSGGSPVALTESAG